MSFSNRPLYQQVREALADRIASGALRSGAAIPSEGDLAREIGVSAGTVRKALRLMEKDRLIVRHQGRGTFVTDLVSSEFGARFARLHGPDGKRIRGHVKAAEMARGPAESMEREQLRLGAGDEVYRIRRVWQDNGGTYLVEDAALPAELFPALEEKRTAAEEIVVLAREYGMLLGTGHERITIAAPPEAIAHALGTPPAMPVTVLDRVVFLLNDRRPVE